jgi:predicted nuclease with TOPRIM domain
LQEELEVYRQRVKVLEQANSELEKELMQAQRDVKRHEDKFRET